MIGGVAFAAVALVAIVIGFVSIADFGGGGGGGGGGNFDEGVKAGVCEVKDLPEDKGGDHIADTDPDPAWDSDPPTHGPHDGIWAIWGAYDQEIQQRKLVHNLEHAGLVVQYGPNVPPGEVEKLRAAVLQDTEWTVLAPYAKLDDRISYAVWAKLATCKNFDQAVLDRYRSFRNKPGGSAESDAAPDGRDWSQEQRQPGW